MTYVATLFFFDEIEVGSQYISGYGKPRGYNEAVVRIINEQLKDDRPVAGLSFDVKREHHGIGGVNTNRYPALSLGLRAGEVPWHFFLVISNAEHRQRVLFQQLFALPQHTPTVAKAIHAFVTTLLASKLEK